jgi:hypothetical protein
MRALRPRYLYIYARAIFDPRFRRWRPAGALGCQTFQLNAFGERMTKAARRALEELEASILFAPDFPKRLTYTQPQLAELLKAKLANVHGPGIEAIERARDQIGNLRPLVDLLGKEHYHQSVPALSRLWKECALQPVWRKVGHALFEIGTPEAMEALLSSIEDHDWFARHMAFKAAFARGSGAAFDYLNARYGIATSEHWILGHVLGFLPSNAKGQDRQDRLKDQRWLDLCARHRRHPKLGYAAREVLRIAPEPDREQALRKAKDAEPPPAPPRIQRDGTLVQRYQRGEFEQVWQEIRLQGNIEGEYRREVLEVAEAAMRRVAHNADLIAERLRAVGWRALLAKYADLRTPPKQDDQAIFSRIAEISGAPVPPALLAFWRFVGGINWVWDYEMNGQPDLGFELPSMEHDALCIYPPATLTYLLKEWIHQKEGCHPDLLHPYRIDLAPDYLHKASYSGGSPYCVEVPFLGADPLFADERHELPFLDYLRLAFRWAGFPGLDQHADRPDVQDFVARFGQGLIPF